MERVGRGRMRACVHTTAHIHMHGGHACAVEFVESACRARPADLRYVLLLALLHATYCCGLPLAAASCTCTCVETWSVESSMPCSVMRNACARRQTPAKLACCTVVVASSHTLRYSACTYARARALVHCLASPYMLHMHACGVGRVLYMYFHTTLYCYDLIQFYV
jgi:hypothetical protein